LVDVKAKDGKVTTAQKDKWKLFYELGIPVYVCRTRADVDALVEGKLEPWEPEAKAAGANMGDTSMRRLSSGARRRSPPRSGTNDLLTAISAAFEEEVKKHKDAKAVSCAWREEALIPVRAAAELKRRRGR
jgi:hypothetical protein